MANQDEVSGFSEEEEEWIKAQRARESRRKGRRPEEGKSMNINSLMDILVILLVFLLKSYGDDPIKVTGDDLQVPKSTTKLTPEDMTTITVARSHVLVNDKKVVDVKDGAVDKSQKKGGDEGLQIQPVYDELDEAISKKKRQTELLDQDFEPVVTIIADQTIPYQLITEVMYTAGQAELSKFKFAVVRTERDAALE